MAIDDTDDVKPAVMFHRWQMAVHADPSQADLGHTKARFSQEDIISMSCRDDEQATALAFVSRAAAVQADGEHGRQAPAAPEGAGEAVANRGPLDLDGWLPARYGVKDTGSQSRDRFPSAYFAA